MSTGAPWSVKGIDPKAREVAKDLARRSGMTLGEWLNTVIVGGEDEPSPYPPERGFARPAPAATGGDLAGVTGALERLTQRIEAAEHRSSLAISGVDQSVQGVLARLTDGEQAQAAVAARVETVERDQNGVAARLDTAILALKDEQEVAAQRLARIEKEAASPRSAQALKALEAALGKIAGQLYESDGKNRAVLGEIGREFDTMQRKLDAIEAKPDAEALVEGLVGRIAERLEAAEGKTAEAIRALETSFAGLDERMRVAEARPQADPEDGLERLAADLSERFDAARTEMAAKLEGAVEGRFDQMERVVHDLTGHVEAAERRSQQAIERMGHEVLRVADNLGRRMISVESRTADAIEQVGGEVTRAAQVMEQRARASDHAHASALEKLGGEIAGISERLAERIAASERRSAQAIDDVGEQIVRTTEKINQRYDKAASDLADRIKQSEERTARFLEEAREKIDARLTETQTRIAEQVTPVHKSFADVSTRLEQMEATASYMPPFGQAAARVQESDDIFADPGPMRARMDPPARLTPAPAPPPIATAPDRELFEARREAASPAFGGFDGDDDPFAPLDDFTAPGDRIEPLDALDPTSEPFPAFEAESPALAMSPTEEPAVPAGPLTTRDLLARARAAAKANGDAAAAAMAPAPKGGLLGRLKLGGLPGALGGKPALKRGSTLRTALIASATAAALGATSAGWLILAQDGPDAEPTQQAQGDPTDPVLYGEAATRPETVRASSLSVAPMGAAVVAPTGEAAAEARALYTEAARKLNNGQNATGLAELKKAANLGHAPAQLHLARLYEMGEAGVAVDPAESRRWTERAASSGDRRAMHNLGLLYFEGVGGRKDLTLAAQWFRRAAEQGLADSQYNLGLVYENGYGVTKNAAEAYKWYVVAARSGDAEGRTSAERLQRTLSAEAQAAAERSALAFRAAGGASLQAGAATSTINADVASAQRALSGLGYYQGPTDGRSSPALVAAVAAWQRDQGLPADGIIDTDVTLGLARAG